MKVAAHDILVALSKRHSKDLFLTQVKTGPTVLIGAPRLYILDGLAISRSWRRPKFHGYEVKVSRSDFLSDDKWLAYLDYCHAFSFACPAGLIKPEELPPEVGLVELRENGRLHTVRAARIRSVEIPREMLYYIIISQLDSDRIPFFSDKREAARAWLQHKIDDKALGQRLGTAMARRLDELTWQLEEARSRFESRKAAALDHIFAAVSATGALDHVYGLEKRTEVVIRLATGNVPRSPEDALRRIEDIVVAAQSRRRRAEDHQDPAVFSIGHPTA